jgi:hypothetical protein
VAQILATGAILKLSRQLVVEVVMTMYNTCNLRIFVAYLTLREEHRLRVFENRVLRRIFGPERDEVTGDWRKLHNEDLDRKSVV